ncbi:MAG: RNA methyltransferase [Spirochaetales bacterium]|nr:RNA methyltransferase [Candidatus Physcosoma equi]
MDKSIDYGARIQIVLVETQDGANIGSVCRAMKTMGLTNLAIVGDREYDENRVRTLALHASDLWENAKRYKTLDEALASSIFTVGATRRRGKFRKMSSYSPEQLCEKIQSLPEGTVSIVFGRESDGLRDDEVNKCASIVTIPTSPLFPSLNLSQAVQIISYALFTGGMQYKTGLVAVDKTRIGKAVDGMSGHLENIGYYKWDEERKWTEQFLSDVIERAALSESELQRFEKVFAKTESIVLFKDKNEEKPEA